MVQVILLKKGIFFNLYCTKNVPLNTLQVHQDGYYKKTETKIMEVYVAYEAIRMRNMTTASPRLGVNCK